MGENRLSETTTYQIGSGTPPSEKCARPGCGHPYAAHGSNGFICCVGKCPCRQFVAAPQAEAK